MTSRTATLTARLIDDISGPAKGAAGALKGLGASAGELNKLGAANPKLGKLLADLEKLKAAQKGIGDYRDAGRSWMDLGKRLRSTQDEIKQTLTALEQAKKKAASYDGVKGFSRGGAIAKEMADARKEVVRLESTYKNLQRDAAGVAAAFEKQGQATRGLKAGLSAAGVSLKSLGRAEDAVRAATAAANAELARQPGLIAAAAAKAESLARANRNLARGMGEAGRAQALSNSVAAGMSAPGRAARAARESALQEAAEARAERAQSRAEARRAVLSGAGIYASHKVNEGTRATLHTYREFDKYSRQTEAFGNFDKAEMAKIIAMAIHGDARTRFNDIQYLQGAKALGGRGVKAGSVMGILPEAGYYGQAMDTNLPEAVAGLEGSLFGFQRDLSTPEKATAAARRTADLQVQAAKAFGLTHHDLKGGYEYGALGASMTGLSEEKLLAFLGLGKKLNIEGSAQGNAWRAMTGKYLSPTRKGREALAGVGIDYSSYQKTPDRLPVDNFANMIAQQYGVKLDKRSRGKLDKAFSNKEVFGNASTFAVKVKDALQGQVGISNARDANKVTASAERFRQTNVEKVDVNGLFDAIIEKISGGNLALANAIFGERQGTRIMAALRDGKVWRESVAKMENTPEGKAREVSEKMSGGFEGASTRWEKALKNLETAFGRSWDDGGEGGFLTGVVDQSAKVVLALADMNSKVLQVGSGLAWLGGKVVGGAGTIGLLGAAFSLNRSAAALTMAAGRLGVGGALNAAGGVGAAAAGAGGAAAGVTAGSVLGAGILASGAVAGAGLDMMTPGTNAGITGLITGAESSLEQTNRVLAAERRAREALKGTYSPTSMGSGRTMALPGGADPRKGFTSEYSASRGAIGDFLLGQEKKSITLPTAPMTPKADVSQIDEAKRKADEAKAAIEGLNITATPTVVASGIQAALLSAQQLNAELAKISGNAAAATSAVRSIPSPNAGGGGRRSGDFSQQMQNSFGDRG